MLQIYCTRRGIIDRQEEVAKVLDKLEKERN